MFWEVFVKPGPVQLYVYSKTPGVTSNGEPPVILISIEPVASPKQRISCFETISILIAFGSVSIKVSVAIQLFPSITSNV